jgi:hypothetical protein
MLAMATCGDDSVADRTAKLIHKYLGSITGEKRGRHPPGDRPFGPMGFSLAIMMERDARDALNVWKTVLTGGGVLPTCQEALTRLDEVYRTLLLSLDTLGT